MGFSIDDAGVCIARNDRLYSELGAATTDEVTETLDVLDIPYEVMVTPATGRRDVRVGFVIRIAWADLPALARWAPAAARHAEDAHAQHGL